MLHSFIIVIAVIFGLVPDEINSFTMKTGDNEKVRFTRESDGRWSTDGKGGEPINEIEHIHFDNHSGMLTIWGHGESDSINLGELLEIPQGTDWKSLNRFAYGNSTLRVVPQSNGFDLVADGFPLIEDSPAAFEIRWDQATTATQPATVSAPPTTATGISIMLVAALAVIALLVMAFAVFMISRKNTEHR